MLALVQTDRRRWEASKQAEAGHVGSVSGSSLMEERKELFCSGTIHQSFD